MKYILLAFLAIHLLAFVLTVYDKIAAKRLPRKRIRESTLFVLSAIGGAGVMFLTMLIIRHKTQHLSFMIGLPLMLLGQLVLLLVLSIAFPEAFYALKSLQ